MRKETQCVHSGTIKDEKMGGINTPIFTSSAFEQADDLPEDMKTGLNGDYA